MMDFAAQALQNDDGGHGIRVLELPLLQVNFVFMLNFVSETMNFAIQMMDFAARC